MTSVRLDGLERSAEKALEARMESVKREFIETATKEFKERMEEAAASFGLALVKMLDANSMVERFEVQIVDRRAK